MDKVWGYLIDIFIAIIIMFVVVAIYFGLRTETVMKSIYESATTDFITNTKRNGVITVRDYENYMEQMGIGNTLFDITFEHTYKLFDPEYRFKTIDEVIDDLNKAYEGTNNYHYREVVTEKPHVDDPVNDGNLNTDTNESILEDAVDGPPDPDHVHNDDCYNGTKHVHSGSSSSGGGCYGERVPGGSSKCGGSLESFELPHWRCTICGYEPSGWGFGGSCPVTDTKLIDGIFYNIPCEGTLVQSGTITRYRCTRCGSTYSSGNGTCSSSIMKPDTYKINCGKTAGKYYDSNGNEVSPICGQVVTSIIPTNANQTVYTNDPLITTAKVTYKDGSTKIVVCDTEFSTASIVKDQEVILKYRQYVGHNHANEGCELGYRCCEGGHLTLEYKANYGGGWSNNKCQFKCSKCNKVIYELINSTSSTYTNTIRAPRYRYLTDRYDTEPIRACSKWNVSDPWSGDERAYEYFKTAYNTYYNKNRRTFSYEELFSIFPLFNETSNVERIYQGTVYTGTPTEFIPEAPYSCGLKEEGSIVESTCSVIVTVIPRSNTCPNGHIYNMNSDGTDPGCPYCRAWIENLRVIYPTSSPIVITIGTTLQDNNIKLLATYMDGHTEEVSSGYIDNLDIHYLGTKPVTIGYKGASVTVMVKTVCATMICDICGYEYNLYPDGTNPGCPRCISRIPVFTGNVMEYEHVNNTGEILDLLYEDGQYSFNVNDTFSISVSNKSSSLARMLLKKIYPSLSNRWFMVERREHIMTK